MRVDWTVAAVLGLAACASSGATGFAGDAGPKDGGSTCTMASTCIGPFFGVCWDGAGNCLDDAQTGSICFANGAKFVPAGTGLRGLASNRNPCFIVTASADGNTYTFTDPQGTLTFSFRADRLLVTCADGSTISFANAGFAATDCATLLPPTSPALGTSRPCVAGTCT